MKHHTIMLIVGAVVVYLLFFKGGIGTPSYAATTT